MFYGYLVGTVGKCHTDPLRSAFDQRLGTSRHRRDLNTRKAQRDGVRAGRDHDATRCVLWVCDLGSSQTVRDGNVAPNVTPALSPTTNMYMERVEKLNESVACEAWIWKHQLYIQN
ncbi:unnamed protein product [Pieris macdunnoughi]|uniref:Uncharacterized protein n=1 Tax=Pieris macdunnoughi TaxID=345717 RepID=A0A821MF58_9NEOP|nr:unnamed protein product [Pieris macdunnoughi]